MQVAYSGSKVEWKEIFEIWDTTRTPRAVVLFLEIFENAITFATGSCQKFKQEALVEWKAPSRRPRQDSKRTLSVQALTNADNRNKDSVILASCARGGVLGN